MTPSRPRQTINRWLEPLLAIAVLAALGYALWYLGYYGYLPPPFFYEPSDPWMDWYNTAFWAQDSGAYDSWGTLYPPLSFVFVHLFSLPSCYPAAEGMPARDCDWLGMVALHGFYLLNLWLIARTFMKIDRSTALPRSIALGAGLPMLYALERGNLILVTFTCILIAYGPLVRSARLRWIAAAMAINFKIYLVASLFPQLLRRRWRWFEGGVIATLLVYLASYLWFGLGTPMEIYRNVAAVNTAFESGSFLDGWYASSYRPFVSLLGGDFVPISALIGSANVDLLEVLLPLLQQISQAAILMAFAAAWLRPEVVPMFRLTGLAIALAVITAESGGYVQCLVILFVFMERWRGIGTKSAITLAYILSIPADIVIDHIAPGVRESYLTDRPVTIDFVLTLGPFLRPLVLMLIAFALSCTTVRAVWMDARAQGGTSRWRYRHDLKVVPGDAPPPPKHLPRS